MKVEYLKQNIQPFLLGEFIDPERMVSIKSIHLKRNNKKIELVPHNVSQMLSSSSFILGCAFQFFIESKN